MIAHRLSTIRDADIIAVVSKGKIVEVHVTVLFLLLPKCDNLFNLLTQLFTEKVELLWSLFHSCWCLHRHPLLGFAKNNIIYIKCFPSVTQAKNVG